ncbi:DUF4013 domain-containing protein [Halioxenophilus aromaticivorans]|uniref:Tetratricopeptide repeat protein n=1 Tax=Halioxenophilus aromaticivorans TaxID=1306992 RepID=A0AAV3U215_9ALTE
MSQCKYHPLVASRYHCQQCQSHTCDKCCDENPTGDQDVGRRCFTCGQTVTDMGSAHSAAPFWRRLDKIYRYGLSANALVVIAACSLLTVFSLYNPWLLIIPSIILTRYSFNCLEQTALGSMKAPSLTNSFSGGITLLVQLTVIILLAGGLVAVCAYYLGPNMAALAGFVVLFTLPAIFILLAINGTLGEAISPANIGQMISATGATYIIMLLFIFVMVASVGVINALIGDGHEHVQFFAQNLVANYYTVVVFHLMGYLVFQKQEALGFYASDSDFSREPRTEFEIEQARIEVLVKEGQYEHALDAYRDVLPKHPNNIALWEKCLKLMCFVGTEQQVSRFADQILPRLINKDDDFYIAKIYRDILRKAPQFRPKRSANTLRIAQVLFALGDYRAVAKLLHEFHKRHSEDNREIYAAYDLLANSLERIPGLEPKAKNYRVFLKRLEPSLADTLNKPRPAAF